MRKRTVVSAVICIFAVLITAIIAHPAGSTYARDVSVTALTISPEVPKAGEPCTITVTVKNEGRVWAANFNVSLSVGGSKYTETIPRLAPGRSTTKTFTHQFTKAGFYTLEASVGPIKGEDDLTDNTMSKMIMTEGAVNSTHILNNTLKNEDISWNAHIDSAKIWLNNTNFSLTSWQNESDPTKIEGSKIVNFSAQQTIPDKSITSIKFAPNALPFNITHNNTKATTTSPTYKPTGCNATINTERDTAFIITYNAVSTTPFDVGNTLYIKCTIDGVDAEPGIDIPIADDTHVNLTATFTFYNASVPAGTHNIAIWFRSSNSGNVSLNNQTLAVITLPA